MPEISLFFGIRITMYYEDHNPPHFHAEYAGNEATIDIQNAHIVDNSRTPPDTVVRQIKLHIFDVRHLWKQPNHLFPN